jgi:hypothetical protein
MLRKLVPLAALLATALLATAALADPIQVTFTGVNGVAAFGYYVGPYYGQLEGQNVSLYCDDFANEVSFGQKWQANLTKITSGSDLSNTRYGGVANALQDYQEIAWLDTQFAVQPSTEYGDIHATIWDLFDPQGAPLPSSGRWLKLAQESYRTMTYDNFRVVTNVGPVLPTGQVQEFLTVLPPGLAAATVSSPEPAPVLLIGLGLLAVGLLLGGIKRAA